MQLKATLNLDLNDFCNGNYVYNCGNDVTNYNLLFLHREKLSMGQIFGISVFKGAHARSIGNVNCFLCDR